MYSMLSAMSITVSTGTNKSVVLCSVEMLVFILLAEKAKRRAFLIPCHIVQVFLYTTHSEDTDVLLTVNKLDIKVTVVLIVVLQIQFKNN